MTPTGTMEDDDDKEKKARKQRVRMINLSRRISGMSVLISMVVMTMGPVLCSWAYYRSSLPLFVPAAIVSVSATMLVWSAGAFWASKQGFDLRPLVVLLLLLLITMSFTTGYLTQRIHWGVNPIVAFACAFSAGAGASVYGALFCSD